jgi:hypothetical protein
MAEAPIFSAGIQHLALESTQVVSNRHAPKPHNPKRFQARPRGLFVGWALTREDFTDLVISLRPRLKNKYLEEPRLRYTTCLSSWGFLPPEFNEIHSAPLRIFISHQIKMSITTMQLPWDVCYPHPRRI